MELTKQQKDSIFIDLLINTFMSNPLLYDKSEEHYIYTEEKIKLLTKLTDYLRDEFQIIKRVPDIVSAWQKLVGQFKKADEKQQTGSAAVNNDFPYYKDLLFLKNTLKHKNSFSTMKVTTSQSINTNVGISSLTMQSTTVPRTSTCTRPSHVSSVAAPIAPANNYSENTYSNNLSENYLQSNFFTPNAVFSESQPHLPAILPYSVPSFGQHPYWPMVLPYNFGSAMPLHPHLQLPPHAPSVMPNLYMPISPTSAMSTANQVQIPPTGNPEMSMQPQSSMISINPSAPLTIQNKPMAKHTPGTSNSLAEPYPSSRTSGKRVPQFDDFAKKKLKTINNNDQQIQEITNHLSLTLDNINKKMETSKSNVETCTSNSASDQSTQNSKLPSSADYSNLLRQALSKVPAELQDELMEYILEELISNDIDSCSTNEK